LHDIKTQQTIDMALQQAEAKQQGILKQVFEEKSNG